MVVIHFSVHWCPTASDFWGCSGEFDKVVECCVKIVRLRGRSRGAFFDSASKLHFICEIVS